MSLSAKICMHLLIALVVFVLPGANTFAEDKEHTLSLLDRYRHVIIEVSTQLGIEPRLLISAIYADRRMNYNLLDQSFDSIVARSGRDNSVGLGQVRVSTGIWVCKVLANPDHPYFLRLDYSAIDSVSCDRDTIIACLDNPRLNIIFAAIYSTLIINRWRSAGYDNISQPEIFATMYNLGPYRRDGSERKPHGTPAGNEFGYVARHFYYSQMLVDDFPIPVPINE